MPVTIQVLGRLDHDLHTSDSQLLSSTAAFHPDGDVGALSYHISLSYLWVLGAYELIRAMNLRKREANEDDQALVDLVQNKLISDEEAYKYIELEKNNRINYLFLHNDIYTHKLFYEYTIFSAYIGNKIINDEIIKILNNNDNQAENNNLLENMKFYKSILRPINILKLDNNIGYSNLNNFECNLKSSSSCLIKNQNNGYKLNVRYVNYNIQPDGSYTDCDKHIITLNKYVDLDNNFNIITEKWMETPFEDRRYIGIEDIRLWEQKDNNIKFIGTGYHKNNKIGIVAGKYDTQNCKFDFNEIVPNFNNALCEKNWVFVNYKNEEHVIYKWNPLQICKINDENSILKLVEERKMPKIFSYVRGSSCGFTYKKQLIQTTTKDNITLIAEENEIWFITHLVSYENPRHYYHLIAVFDENMNLLRYSAPFKFEGESIEYSLSIVVENERVLINYSTWDRTTRIGIYDKKYIDSIVKYT
jgi:hypothetical protein